VFPSLLRDDARQTLFQSSDLELTRKTWSRPLSRCTRADSYFKGAEAAAELLAEQEKWRQAKVVKANPDALQLPVRARALAEGKVVYMAVPRLAEAKPFVLLDPRRLSQTPRRAASIRGAMHEGQPVSVSQVRRIDLVVCGSVVVTT
jgi:5-formyltetrahydrofolate cyclo-ligase